MKTKFYYLALCGLLVAGCGGSGNNLPPINAAPTISAIADQLIEANVQSMTIDFTVTDDQTPESNLVITASSSDADVVQNDGIAVGGSDGFRSLSITPVIDTVGDTLVTVIVTDSAGLMTSTAFMLTVDPQQLSFQQFLRSTFADAPSDAPRLINAIEFDQDAAGDDFADLLAQ